MERRYLVAALAIVATFALGSRGMRTLQHVSQAHFQRMDGTTVEKCDAGSSAAAALASKVRTHLRPRYAEEAQLLAEMDLPIARVQAKVAEQMVRQNFAMARCARMEAMQQAQRARRDAMRARQEARRYAANATLGPISVVVRVPDDVERQIKVNAAIASRAAVQNLKLQLQQYQPIVVDVSDEGNP